MSSMGIGILGCGNISSAYLRLAGSFSGITVNAVADLNMEVARAQGEAFGVPAVTVDELLARDDVQIVVNLTIPGAHYEVTKSILEAGKHAYSEKPVVLALEEGLVLVDLAQDKGLRVGSAPDTFLGGSHQHARSLIDRGKIGRVISGTAHIMSHGMENWHPNPDFFFQPGGGPMLDMGPYYITNLVQLLGPVERVAALTSRGATERQIGSGPREGEMIPVDTPTTLHALLEFSSGATVTLSTSWDVWAHRHDHIELYGSDGTLFLPDPNFFAGTLEASAKSEAVTVMPPWAHPFSAPNTEQGSANYRGAGLADMAQAIQQGRPHRCSLELALHVVEVMTAVHASGENKTFVELTTTCERPSPLGPNEAQALLV